MKTVPTVQQQTGWERSICAPMMICQDNEALNKISQYNFDLDDKDFIAYHKSRTGICIGNEENPELARFLLLSPGADTWLLTSHDYKYSKSNGPVTFGEARELSVKFNKIMKARLQDSWELFVLKGRQALAVPGVDHSTLDFIHPGSAADSA